MHIYEILQQGGVWSTKELAKEADISVADVRKEIKKLRFKFLNNVKDVEHYIFTTRGGYTMDTKPEHAMYEARLRIAMGTGILINGVYVFKTGKKIAEKSFKQLKIEYKPKLLEISKI